MKDDLNVTNHVIPLKDIFSAPLLATLDADVIASEKFVEFIRTYGFERDGESQGNSGGIGFGKLRMVTFQYNVNGAERTISIPLLSLIPLPLIQIQDADFKFNVKIVSAVKEKRYVSILKSSENSFIPEEEPIYDFGAIFVPEVNVKTESEMNESLFANIKSTIRLRNADIPSGLATLLNLMGEGVTEERTKVSGTITLKDTEFNYQEIIQGTQSGIKVQALGTGIIYECILNPSPQVDSSFKDNKKAFFNQLAQFIAEFYLNYNAQYPPAGTSMKIFNVEYEILFLT